jgi:hypothetical protein
LKKEKGNIMDTMDKTDGVNVTGCWARKNAHNEKFTVPKRKPIVMDGRKMFGYVIETVIRT